MKKDLTQGNVTRNMLLFAGPMILGNLLQQFYNIADSSWGLMPWRLWAAPIP